MCIRDRRYSELPRFYRENVTVDVAMLQVTPMDSHGNFNFGLNASHLADMLDQAKTVIVEVNRNMPWVNGLSGCEINIKDVDFVVEGDDPPIAQLGGGEEPTEVDRAVANLVVPQIPDGACLQLGIGGMPNAIGSMIAQSDPVSYTHLLFAKQKQPRENSSMAAYAQPSFE